MDLHYKEKKKNGGINKNDISMKSINNYISEKLVINKNAGKIGYIYFPKTKNELRDIIKQRIKEEGNKCDLNDIDVSKINDMSYLFYGSDFNGDISKWDVSNVKDMYGMFKGSKFNQDISKWDVSGVKDMQIMFAYSKFNQDISNWKINKNASITNIFKNSQLEGKEQEWWRIRK